MKLVVGELVGITEGEYSGKPTYRAQVLERRKDGASVFQLDLEPSAYGSISAFVNQEVALTYWLREGVSPKTGNRYSIPVGGRLLTATEIESITDLFSVVA